MHRPSVDIHYGPRWCTPITDEPTRFPLPPTRPPSDGLCTTTNPSRKFYISTAPSDVSGATYGTLPATPVPPTAVCSRMAASNDSAISWLENYIGLRFLIVWPNSTTCKELQSMGWHFNDLVLDQMFDQISEFGIGWSSFQISLTTPCLLTWEDVFSAHVFWSLDLFGSYWLISCWMQL